MAYYKLEPYIFVEKAVSGLHAWNKKQKMAAKFAKLEAKKAAAKPKILHGKQLIRYNLPGADQGATLIVADNSKSIDLISPSGDVLYSWLTAHKEKDIGGYRLGAHVYPNGDLLTVKMSHIDTPYGRGLTKVDKDSNLIWKLEYSFHHYFDVAENGNIYGVAHKLLNEPIQGMEYLPPPIIADEIMIVSNDGVLIKRIPLLEAFKGTPFEKMLHKNFKGVSKGDYTHVNSVYFLREDVNYKLPVFKPGMILISIRSKSIIAVLDPVSEKIVWAEQGPWHFQHDAKFLPDGNIMLFDNLGDKAPGEKITSRVISYNPATQEIDWYYNGSKKHRINSNIRSGAQLLSNGNILIHADMNGLIVEVTPEKQIVWEYRSPRLTLGYVKRYNLNDLDFLKSQK